MSKFNKFVIAAATALLPLASQAGVVLVAGAKSGASKLTAEQATQLFLGKSAALPGAGEAVLIDQAEGSPVRDAFYGKVVGKSPAQVKAIWSRLVFSGSAKPPKEAANAAEVKKLVAADPNAVGYIDSADVDGSVKVLLSAD